MAVELSDFPESGPELEDYVAALFLAAGHFVEKNVEEQNVLELDIVATDYSQDPPRVILSEAKSGHWGYSDLFKVVGWMRYLKIGEGAFFCQGSDGKNLGRVANVFGPLDVAVVDFEDFADPLGKFTAAGLPVIEHPDEITHWRWVHHTERLLTAKLISMAKTATADGPRAVLTYHRLVNDGIFFEPTIASRLQALYAAYQSHPRLTLSCAREMDGHAFDPDVLPGSSSDRITEALRHGQHLLLQAAFYAEHRAKLAILKAAIDMACRLPKVVAKLIGPGFKMGAPPLPGSFVEGLRWLTAQPTFTQYARLWQIFLWSWGGFYLEDRQDQEFAWLSTHSGVPVDEIATALDAFDEFFPAGPSWVTTAGTTHCRIVKMVPVMFRGLGAYHRLIAYGVETYQDLGYADYTASDMARWHNRLVALLKGEEPP